MTTQSNVSSPIEVTPVRPLSWPLALAILVLGVILGVFVANLAAAINQSDPAAVPERVIRDFPARPNLLELERKAHITTQANIQRGREAEAARYTSLGLFYAAGTEAKGQQATTAEAARYNGLAEFYGANVTPSPLDNALFVYHQSERGRISADSHTPAWPPRPAQFKPSENVVTRLDEMDLTTYHQSEWGRAPSTALPVVENKASADRDIGLMEFYAIPKEASQQHTELGTLGALSSIDPADRKFFMPGNGVNAGENDLTAYYQSERDRTPNTELGAVEKALAVYHQSEWGRAPNPVLGVEALSKIDPADRKFFSPGYGTQP